MHTDSELESDTSSINDGISSGMGGSSGSLANQQPMSREQIDKRVESLVQENRVLKMEVDTFKLRVRGLQEENKELRKASVNIQARAEQEEEYISNKLLKKIQSLKKEKEMLANNYEREEEYLTNDLSRKLHQLRNEKVQLEQTLEQEQEHMVNKLMRKIERLEAETSVKQINLEQLRREKIELENTLEQEQESLVNRLWKKMERLEAEKRLLQEKLDQPVSAPMSPHSVTPGAPTFGASASCQPTSLGNVNIGSIGAAGGMPLFSGLVHQSTSLPAGQSGGEQASSLTEHIINLRREVSRLKANLEKAERDSKESMAKLVREEKAIRDENLRLQRRLQMEVDRREALCRHLSESESSLEMDDERHFNESSRVRTVSSPLPGFLMHGNVNPSNVSIPSGPPGSVVSTQQQIQCATSIFSHPLSGPQATTVLSSSHTSTQCVTQIDRCHSCNQIRNPTLHLMGNTASSPPLNAQMSCASSKMLSTQSSTGSSNMTNTSNMFNAASLTASSSLSSSSSSLNSNNKANQHQQQQHITNAMIHDQAMNIKK